MTTTTTVVTEALQRVCDDLPGLLDGLTPEQLSWRPGPDANPIGWLVWHLTRVQDNHIADVGEKLGVPGSQELWQGEWAQRFALPYGPDASGYGQTSEEVGQFHADAELLLAYNAAVQQASEQVLAGLDESRLDEIVDTHWDPPVTAASRLVSVVNDITQHLGQAAYAKGLLPRA